jgi:hypothetical protein
MCVKRKKVTIVAAGMIVAAVLVVVLWPGEKEPEYQGKKLSEWLDTYDSYFGGSQFPTLGGMEEAAEAVRHIGTNCVPVLLRWYCDEPSSWRTKLREILQKAPGRLGRLAAYKEPSPERRFRRHRLARYGFIILGPQASSAIPELKRLERATNSASDSADARLVLSYIQSDRLAANLAIVVDEQSPPLLRALTVHSIGVVGTNAPGVQSAIVKALQDNNSFVRSCATDEVRRIAPEVLTNGVSRP